MQSVLKHDYLGFFRKEMSYRHLGVYPPYVFYAASFIRMKV